MKSYIKLCSENTLKIILNVFIFKIGWMICILKGDVGALIYMPVALLLYIIFVSKSVFELYIVAVAASLGVLRDLILIKYAVFFIPSNNAIFPFWLACLWVLYSTLYVRVFDWFCGRYLVSFIVGTVFGGGSYVIGFHLTGSNFFEPYFLNLSILSISWGVLFTATLELVSFILKRKT